MAELSKEMCLRLAAARRAKGLTQSALAGSVGCKQSAISMLEAGIPGKLSMENIGKIAAELGLKLEAAAAGAPAAETIPGAAEFGYCPDALCPSAMPYLLRGTIVFKPLLQRMNHGETRCAHCGEMLEKHCPECGAPIHSEGAFCPFCGAARITNTLPPTADPESWIEKRRAEIQALR